ncbi:MAG: acetyl-CoA acetyltransferase [Acidimicrobiales bacterium]
MAVDPRSPCLVGAAQAIVRPGEGPAPEPLELWAECASRAVSDAGADRARLLRSIGSLQVLYCQSWPYDDPVTRLSARLGIDPGYRAYSGIGGTTPQSLVTSAATAIATGQTDGALIVGGEALETVRQAKKAGQRLPWSFRDPEKKPFPFEAPFHPAEVAHEVFQAWLTFALFDIARRHHFGIGPDEHRRALGALLAPMTDVAATNPYAWFPQRRTVEELIDVAPDNRMVGYPYTKAMVAIMDVDMAAALVLTSHAKADELGVPPERRVYLRGWGAASDPVYVAEHEQLWASPAMAAASADALGMAGVGIDDVAHLDLYSCFASSVAFARDALDLPGDDPRGVTVTGGLPFAGGPGSGYLLHSLATMVDVLRRDPGAHGLVSGVGMHMTKHAFGVYSTTPPTGRLEPSDEQATQRRLDAGPQRVITPTYEGPATVAAYSVIHDRTGAAVSALAVCDLPDGTRAYGRADDPGMLSDMEREEWTGSSVAMTTGPGGVNRLG